MISDCFTCFVDNFAIIFYFVQLQAPIIKKRRTEPSNILKASVAPIVPIAPATKAVEYIPRPATPPLDVNEVYMHSLNCVYNIIHMNMHAHVGCVTMLYGYGERWISIGEKGRP